MRFLILVVSLAYADNSAPPAAQPILLREIDAAKKLGDDFDPRKLDGHHLGLYIDVYRSHDGWHAFLGEDHESCCEEPEDVKPPVSWREIA